MQKISISSKMGNFTVVLLFFVEDNSVESPVMWKSKKLRRVVKSAMAGETLIQVKVAEVFFWLVNLLNKILYGKNNGEHKIEIEYHTDNQQLYDSVHSIRPIQDKRLLMEISLLRKRLNKNKATKFN